MSLLSRLFRIHQLCLDAPLVAASGYVLVCRLDGWSVDWGTATIIFLTVWLAYVGDRWLDARRNPRSAMGSPRHRIFVQEPDRWLKAWTAVLALDVVWSVYCLEVVGFVYGLGMAVLSVVYTWVTQRSAWRGSQKEIMVGVLFGLAAGGFSPWLGSSTAWIAMWVIGSLCVFNCLCISWTERELDAHRGERSAFTRFSGDVWGRNERRLLYILLVVSLGGALWVSIPFAVLAALYLGSLIWMVNKESQFSRVGFSLVADWGILGVFVVTTFLS